MLMVTTTMLMSSVLSVVVTAAVKPVKPAHQWLHSVDSDGPNQVDAAPRIDWPSWAKTLFRWGKRKLIGGLESIDPDPTTTALPTNAPGRPVNPYEPDFPEPGGPVGGHDDQLPASSPDSAAEAQLRIAVMVGASVIAVLVCLTVMIICFCGRGSGGGDRRGRGDDSRSVGFGRTFSSFISSGVSSITGGGGGRGWSPRWSPAAAARPPSPRGSPYGYPRFPPPSPPPRASPRASPRADYRRADYRRAAAAGRGYHQGRDSTAASYF